MIFDHYQLPAAYDEMFDESGQIRPHYQGYEKKMRKMSAKKLQSLQASTDHAQLLMGMTFNVYHDSKGIERILQMDVVPRIIPKHEWEVIEKGLQQRIYALNLFIGDLYNEQKIIKDKVVPTDLLYSSPGYLKLCEGIRPPKDIWCHISGSDIIRDRDGSFLVLEDNLRCPSGVSYLLENREILKKTFPEIFEQMDVRPVSDYAAQLRKLMEYVAPDSPPAPALLTPGIYNSAYFEHSYLAQEMGIELVEGRDLVVKNDRLYMSTTKGLKEINVLYRRIDDNFLDPLHFNPQSMLGTPGLFDAFRKGNLTLVNAPGTGVADDKAIYPFVPRIIRYYLQEEPIIQNVQTYLCSEADSLQYVLENIGSLVVKETNSAGGYGMLIGPKSTKAQQEEFKLKVKANPRNYIAQPTISLSTVPSLAGDLIEPRHVDLRPYILYGENIRITPGALTRVALSKGSLVVNSSQGGGAKDTWVLNS